MGAYVLGIDLGGTKIEAAVFDGDGKIIGRHRDKTEAWRSEEEVFERIVAVANQSITNAKVEAKQIAAVGIGAPGPLDPDTGYIIETVNLPFRNFPLGPRLSERFNHCPVTLNNDVDAGTYGEFKAGAAQGAKFVLGVFVGTGIGGGLILNGEMYNGFNKNAAEIGHIVIKVGGPKDRRGVRGTMEGLAARPALARDIKKEMKRGKKSLMAKKMDKKTGTITSGDIKECYDAGDEVVKKIVHRAARHLGLGIGSLVNVLSPEVIVFGGGVVEALGEAFLKRVEKDLRKVAFDFSMKNVKIVKAQLGDDAGITGASLLARDALGKKALGAS
ncbi:MAG: ROK family protein [Acidobacteria bacterium]|nr:ROK family protein [Acidobacteriota bacterium]